MSTIKYDKDSNVLHIGKKNSDEVNAVSSENDIEKSLDKNIPVENKVSEKRELKGYILTVTDDADDIERLKNGQFPLNNDKVKLFPALALNDDDAINAAYSKGFTVIHISPYEYIKFQLELIENVAENSNVKIVVNNDMFVAKELKELD